jgi:hypothetical protein
MLEDLGAIQARIGEIQARIAALTPQPIPPPAGAAEGAAAFDQTLQRAQSGAGMPGPGSASPSPGQIGGVSVPPASLGSLPSLPLTPDSTRLVPLQQGGTGQYESLIQTYAAKNGLDPSLVRAVIQTESGGNPRAISSAGAMGLMQLMPGNAQEAGISDPFDPEQNIAAGTQQLSNLMKEYGGDLDLALAGYNAGPGNVRKYGGVPPFQETQSYIRKVRAAMGRSGT